MQYNERQHLGTVLKKFDATDDEILKIEALQDFTKNSYYFDIWPKYNNWIYVYCMRRLQGLIKPEKKRQISFLLAASINNKVYLEGMQGDVIAAFEYYNKALSYYYTMFEDKEGRATLYTNLGSIYESQVLISDTLVYAYLEMIKFDMDSVYTAKMFRRIAA